MIDPKREHLAIHEASRLRIPIIAITDSNCDPDPINFLIPGNDDAIRSVRLITAGIADAALAGQMRNEVQRMDRDRAMTAAADIFEPAAALEGREDE